MTEALLSVRAETLERFTRAVLERWGTPAAIAARRWECERRRRRDDIPLAPGLVRQLRDVAAATGVPFTLGA